MYASDRMTDPTAQPVPPAHAWYQRAFDELYPLIYRHRDDASARREVGALLKTLHLRPSLRAVDIACGAGRHLRAMRDMGFDAVGVDLSQPLLDEAAAQRDLRRHVVRGDVRALPYADATFDLATNLFTSFGYFDDDAANRQALAEMARLLRPGGRLVLDHANRARVGRDLVAHDVQQHGDYSVTSRRAIERNRMVKRMAIRDGSGRVEQIVEDVRLFERDELADWFADAGLDVARVMGHFGGASFGPDSPRMIFVGVRR